MNVHPKETLLPDSAFWLKCFSLIALISANDFYHGFS
jgi:hypothetical protein